jgi:hypothetical protein
VKGNQSTATAAIGIAAVKDFPLGFLLAYQYSGFIQRPALFWRFSFL